MSRQVYNPFLPLDTYIPDGQPHVFTGKYKSQATKDIFAL